MVKGNVSWFRTNFQKENLTPKNVMYHFKYKNSKKHEFLLNVLGFLCRLTVTLTIYGNPTKLEYERYFDVCAVEVPYIFLFSLIFFFYSKRKNENFPNSISLFFFALMLYYILQTYDKKVKLRIKLLKKAILYV